MGCLITLISSLYSPWRRRQNNAQPLKPDGFSLVSSDSPFYLLKLKIGDTLLSRAPSIPGLWLVLRVFLLAPLSALVMHFDWCLLFPAVYEFDRFNIHEQLGPGSSSVTWPLGLVVSLNHVTQEHEWIPWAKYLRLWLFFFHLIRCVFVSFRAMHLLEYKAAGRYCGAKKPQEEEAGWSWSLQLREIIVALLFFNPEKFFFLKLFISMWREKRRGTFAAPPP